MKVTERSALVQVVASTQQLTSHAGLVLVRELASRLGVEDLLNLVTVKKRSRGYSPAQAILGLCETLIAGGECLEDVTLLRGDSAQELLRGHGLPEPTTLGRFLRRFSLGHIGQLNRTLEELFARVHPLLDRETVTLDLDATYIEHHGPVGSRQGTRGTYKGKVCWHPLLCFAGETGEWLHAKLRNGHAGASTGATRFVTECLRRLPDGVRLFLRADEGFWGQDFFAQCERKQITYAGRSSASTSPSAASTLRVEANNAGATAGSPPSTPSPSPSKADSETLSTNRAQSSYTYLGIDDTGKLGGARGVVVGVLPIPILAGVWSPRRLSSRGSRGGRLIP